MSKLQIILKAIFQLNPSEVMSYGLYQLGLQSGYYRWLTPAHSTALEKKTVKTLREIASQAPRTVLPLPDTGRHFSILGDSSRLLVAEAEEIIAGKVRLYGAAPRPIDLRPHAPLVHWTKAQKLVQGDIKDVWEQARCGWAFTLGRAYHLTGEERYCQAFWLLFENFCENNPTNLGSNWASGQEVALRILAFSYAWGVLGKSAQSTVERKQQLLNALYAHADRIPATLSYARAQNNNHLLSEAVGLFTAGCLLDGLPEAKRWRKLGWVWILGALDEQINEDGTYTQHSMNYHRLMLHLVLWVNALMQKRPERFPDGTIKKLVAATNWLLTQLDPFSGRTPNLGSNDGALILPLTSCAPEDYRPVAQAASLAFLERKTQPAGPWDELSLWLGLPVVHTQIQYIRASSTAVLRLGDGESWGTLRAARYHSRPSQADQLHVELWWRGSNLTLDAGTYRYNAPSPWDNALKHTTIHNTIEVDGKDQMLAAGRFLWLDWAQGRQLTRPVIGSTEQIAEHNGYRWLGVNHRRTLTSFSPLHWRVEDLLYPQRRKKKAHSLRLHWLLPDLPFKVEEHEIRLQYPKGIVQVGLSAVTDRGQSLASATSLTIMRAGLSVHGPALDMPEVLGWYSPTYSVKVPALSILFTLKTVLPVRIITVWNFIP